MIFDVDDCFVIPSNMGWQAAAVWADAGTATSHVAAESVSAHTVNRIAVLRKRLCRGSARIAPCRARTLRLAGDPRRKTAHGPPVGQGLDHPVQRTQGAHSHLAARRLGF